jgi:alkylresorcinol/alkylpyrone synthase
MTQILAVRSVFPPYQYPQAELTRKVAEIAGLTPARQALLERLHHNAGVATRHTVLPLDEYGTLAGIGPTNDRYIDEATSLGKKALSTSLHVAGVSPADVDLLVVTSVTGVAVPSLDARLIPLLGLRPDVKRLPVFGLGCVAGASALARVHDYLLAWPGHTAALLAIELCSLTWQAGDITTADMVASGLFGDGAVALIATGNGTAGDNAAGDNAAGDPGSREHHGLADVLATRSEVYPGSGDTLGWRLGSEGFRIVLTADLADVVERRLAGSVTSFLAGHGLTTDDIATWICHPGGPKVIDAIRKSLKLPESAVASARRSLAEVGNLSSASVLQVLERSAAEGQRPGTFGMMIGLGPGVSAELVLLKWLSSGRCWASSRWSGWPSWWCRSGTRRPVSGRAAWSTAPATSPSWWRCTSRCSRGASSSRWPRTGRSCPRSGARCSPSSWPRTRCAGGAWPRSGSAGRRG